MQENQVAFVKKSAQEYADILEIVVKTIPMKSLTADADEIVLSSSDYKDITTSIFIGYQKFGQFQGNAPRERPMGAKADEKATDKQIAFVKRIRLERHKESVVDPIIKSWETDIDNLTKGQASEVLKIMGIKSKPMQKP